jgi:hypothetical protein
MLIDYETLRAHVDARLKAMPKDRIFLLGDALSCYRQSFLKDMRGVTLLDKDYWYPQPRHLIALALAQIRKKKSVSPLQVVPIYLYPKECQIRGSSKG